VTAATGRHPGRATSAVTATRTAIQPCMDNLANRGASVDGTCREHASAMRAILILAMLAACGSKSEPTGNCDAVQTHWYSLADDKEAAGRVYAVCMRVGFSKAATDCLERTLDVKEAQQCFDKLTSGQKAALRAEHAKAAAAPTPTVAQREPAPRPTWRAAGAPGPLYMAFSEGAPAMIDVDGSVKRISGASGANRLHGASDGTVFATARSTSRSLRIFRLDGASAKSLPALSMPELPYYAVDARGTDIVVAFSDGGGKAMRIAHLAGSAWKTEPADVDIGNVTAVALGANDELWIAGYTGAAVRRGGSWTKYECPDRASCVDSGLAKIGDEMFVQAKDGNVWRDFEVKGDKLVLRVNGPAATWTSSGHGRNGSQLSVRSGDPRIEVRHEASMPEGVSLPFRAGYSAATFDASGRAWLVGDRGLAIVDAKAGTTTRYPQRAFGLVANRIESFAVVGGGPAAPAPVEPRMAKTVTASMRINRKVGNEGSEVRVCPNAVRTIDPCGTSKPSFVAPMHDGKITLSSVPEGEYDIAFKATLTDGKVQWVTLSGALSVKPGDNVRTDPLDLELTERVSYF